MSGPRSPRAGRRLAAIVLAAGTLACGDRSRHVVRFPVPEIERISVASETRPGCWLSPGDAVRWPLPPGPSRRLQGSYASMLAGEPAGTLRFRVIAGGGSAREYLLPLSATPTVWHAWTVDLPETDASGELEVTYRADGPASPARSLFLTEPFLSIPRREPVRTIVLLLVDTLRADHVSAYGYRLATTPRLDRFFRDGLRAEKGVTTANWTLPAHASLFASASVARHGAGRTSNLLAEGFDTLAERMAAAGYRTLGVTGGGLVDPAFGLAQGFDRYFTVREPAARAFERALALLAEHRKESVFLFLHTFQVHDYAAEQVHDYAADEAAARELFGGVSALGPDWQKDAAGIARARGDDPNLTASLRNRYDAALRGTDEAFGRFVEGLEADGRLARTAMLFTSDHGEALCDRRIQGRCLSWGHASPYLFEEELRVPLELSVPWIPKARGLAHGNASLLDVAPTLLEAAGLPVPDAFEGRSLLSAGPPAGRALVTEAPPLEALAVRVDDHKLIRRAGVPQTSWFDGNPFLVLSVQESFDLSRDPGETQPLPSASDWGADLLAHLDRYLASGFPDALVVRLPAVPALAGREIVVRASGRGAAPALLTFGLASRGAFSQSGAVTQARFARPRAPVWLAFEPAPGTHALALDVKGAGPAFSVLHRSLEKGSYRWDELGWPGRDRLPSEVAVFTTPPTAARAGAMLPLPGEVVARLLALGYLPFASSPGSNLPVAPSTGSDRGLELSPGEVRIDRAD